MNNNRIIERIYFSGRLDFENSFHTGSGAESIFTDQCLTRDTAGTLLIRGTSFCGALKNHLIFFYTSHQETINYYFGSEENKEPARIFVDDLYPVADKPVLTSIRDGIAIRRDRGVVRKQSKYDYEITARGMKLEFSMMLEIREHDENKNVRKNEKLLKAAMLDLIKGNIRVGGHTTRGLGQGKLNNLNVKCFEFPKDLIKFMLKSETPFIDHTTNSQLKKIDASALIKKETKLITIRIECKIENPLLVKDGLRSRPETFIEYTDSNNEEFLKEVDACFVKVVTCNKAEVPVIPGGSLKGAWRSRAEKIVRTLGIAKTACDPTMQNNRCFKKIVKGLEKLREDLKNRQNRYEAICKASCLTCNLFGNSHLGSKIYFSDSALSMADGCPAKSKTIDGVAINRFNSKPVDAALFNARPYINGSFIINIEVRNPNDTELALLMFVIRDFINQTIPLALGFGKNKGFGIVKVDKDKVIIDGINYDKYIEELSEKTEVFKDWQAKWQN